MRTDHPIFHMTDAEARAEMAQELAEFDYVPPYEGAPAIHMKDSESASHPNTIMLTQLLTQGRGEAAPNIPSGVRLPFSVVPPAGSAKVRLPPQSLVIINEKADARRRAVIAGELTQDGTTIVGYEGEVQLVMPPGWSLVHSLASTDYSTLGGALDFLEGKIVPFTKPKPKNDGPVDFGFFTASAEQSSHAAVAKGKLTRDGLVTFGGHPVEFSNFVRPVLVPQTVERLAGRAAVTAETMGDIYREMAIGLGRGVCTPAAGLVDFVGRVHAEVEGGPVDGAAIRRFGYAFGGRAIMARAMRARFQSLAATGERRDPRLPSRSSEPVHMTSAISPLFPDLPTARRYLEAELKGWAPLANTWLNTAIFVLGWTDPNVLYPIADFEAGIGRSLDPITVQQITDAQRQVHDARLARERELETDMRTPSPLLEHLVETASEWVGEWNTSLTWYELADKVAAAAHSASVLDVMALMLMTWRPTFSTFRLGPAPKAKGVQKLSLLDKALPQADIDKRVADEAEREAAAALTDPIVAGRVLVRSVLAPACLRSLYGASVRIDHRGRPLDLGTRAHGLTLRADEDGRMNACLKGERAQLALWLDVVKASGLAPRWRV